MFSVDVKFKNVKKVNKDPDIFYNFESPEKLFDEMSNAPIIEHSNSFFTNNNLINSNYYNVDVGDYEKLYYYCSLYDIDPKSKIKQTLNGKQICPILLSGTNDVYYLLDGDVEMVIYKVLNLFPLVKEINVSGPIS